MSRQYYAEKLSAVRLEQVYALAPPRVKQYLEAEIQHCLKFIRPSHRVLELGCGYGRVLKPLSSAGKFIVGVDNSPDNLKYAGKYLSHPRNCELILMDVAHLAFKPGSFDVVICIQNGLSAFKTDQLRLIKDSICITKTGGILLFSSYSHKFWDERLKWFEIQSDAGLLGEIDHNKTGNGVIVCKDGFEATTLREQDFLHLKKALDLKADINEVDQSSLFFIIYKDTNSN